MCYDGKFHVILTFTICRTGRITMYNEILWQILMINYCVYNNKSNYSHILIGSYLQSIGRQTKFKADSWSTAHLNADLKIHNLSVQSFKVKAPICKPICPRFCIAMHLIFSKHQMASNWGKNISDALAY